MQYAPGNHEGPNRADKGQLGGSCNVTACQLPASAFYFNHSTQAHYCRVCAKAINHSNALDAQRLYGHELCTPVALKDFIIEVGDRRWKVREAVNHEAALNAIAHARVSGSVGAKDSLTDVDKVTRVLADVVQINSDGSERQPYTEPY